MINNNLAKKLIAVTLMTGLSSCGGGSTSPTTTPDPDPVTVSVTGSVSALNGQVAFYSPGIFDSIVAGLFGKPLYANVPGEQSVGAGVTVNLIEVNNEGVQVGAVIATAVTDSAGSYSLDAPEGFEAGSQFVVRAAGNSSSVDARVASLTSDIDSVSDAASSIIAVNAMALGELSVDEISEIHAAVADIVESTDSAAATVADYRSAIVAAAAEDESVANVVSSTVAAGQICGVIKDSAGEALENIRIVVRDFGNWVTRAKTKTDATGAYCVNVPVAGDTDQYIPDNTHTGEYILGALNFTGGSFAASQWWTSTSSNTDGSGGENTQYKAEKISVNSATTVSHDMYLDKDGARITGTVTGTGGVSVEGMRVVIRNYDTFKPLASAKVKADNTYRINVKAADYLISFRNKTRHPFASEIYRAGTTGVNNRNMASRETMDPNTVNTYDAELDSGVVISGLVKDNAGVPVSGEVVYVNNADGGRIEALRTNKNGKFRLWVDPRVGSGLVSPYYIRTRGQAQVADTNGDNDLTATHYALSAGTGLTFDSVTTKVSGKLVSADVTPVPVGSAVVFLTAANGDIAVSAADGSFDLYTATPSNSHKLYIRLDNDLKNGSGVYAGTSISAIAVSAGDSIDATGADVVLGDITVPTLGVGQSVGYVKGNAGAGSTNVTFRIGGANNTFDMVTTKSRGDGSFNVTLPATTYDRIRSKTPTAGNCSAVVVGDGATVTLTYDGTATPPCLN